jgi:6-pyruvoyltetrahydropterin/6-carboxytetrahydropterin synthase
MANVTRMSARYTVRVTKDYLVFCAGHFITYDGQHCERLHGHNYRASCEVTGDLDANYYLFDFIALKNHLKELTDELDHRMLVPGLSSLIKCEIGEKQVTLRYGPRTWSFPREDCAILPVENTTAELLAKYLAARLLEVLKKKHNFTPATLAVEVEESFGQSATYTWTH